MQDQTIPGRLRALDEIEHDLLWLLLRPAPHGPWHTREIALALGDPEQAMLALAGLHADGLAHLNGEFVHATRAATRFKRLALPDPPAALLRGSETAGETG
jgi:hypothetical protein